MTDRFCLQVERHGNPRRNVLACGGVIYCKALGIRQRSDNLGADLLRVKARALQRLCDMLPSAAGPDRAEILEAIEHFTPQVMPEIGSDEFLDEIEDFEEEDA